MATMHVDTVTLEIIENTLRMVRHEMDAVMFRASISPMIRETHDTYPLVADRNGRMLVGQFGSYLAAFLEEFDEELAPGDVIIQNDPYLCGGSISHTPDVLITRPVFHEGVLVGSTSQFGNLLDIGGRTFGSMSVQVKSIYEEGIRFPPVKLYDGGTLNRPLVQVLARNSRAPDAAVADVMALCAATAVGEQRILELCDRFGRDTYLAACDALLERTRRAVQRLIAEKIPETPQSFEDFVDDDGQGNGPFRIRLTVWREGERAVFDFDGTSPQAPGPVNFYLHEGMMKMVIGAYLIMVFDPEILFNEGFYDLLDVRVEEGTILKPRYPAPLGNRHHTLSRWVEVVAGALGRHVPETAVAAGYGSSPHLIFSGTDEHGKPFGVVEILMGGIPGRPAGDGMDGHSWYPQLENTPCEYQEIYYPLVTEEAGIVQDSGGAGYHRGGCAVRKVFRFESAGQVSIYDDRHTSSPVGHRRRPPRRPFSQAAPSRGWVCRRSAGQGRFRRGRAGRPTRVRDGRRRRLGRPASPSARHSACGRREGLRLGRGGETGLLRRAPPDERRAERRRGRNRGASSSPPKPGAAALRPGIPACRVRLHGREPGDAAARPRARDRAEADRRRPARLARVRAQPARAASSTSGASSSS